MAKIYWKQKDGTLINVDDMSEEHLRNTLKMLIRNDWIDMKKEEYKEDRDYGKVEHDGVDGDELWDRDF